MYAITPPCPWAALQVFVRQEAGVNVCFRCRVGFGFCVWVSRSRTSTFLLFQPLECTVVRPDHRGVPELLAGFPLRPPAGVSPELVRPTEAPDIAAPLLAAAAALSRPVLPATPPVLTGATGVFLLPGSVARPGDVGVRCGVGTTGSSPVLLYRFTSSR